MILTDDQDLRRVIEELEDVGFSYGCKARGELGDIQIDNGEPFFGMSFFGDLKFEVLDSGKLPRKVNFKVPISVSDGWYEISEVLITTEGDEIIIQGTNSTRFTSTIPQWP